MSFKEETKNAWSLLTAGASGRKEGFRDAFFGRSGDPGIDGVVQACATWLLVAQESSSSRDGGVASHYSFKDGWASSYPETTGYIVPTLLEVARREQRDDCGQGAFRMLEWLESIQHEDGSFPGGNVDALPSVPVVFNTGQILFGLVAGLLEWGEAHRGPAEAAADWLLAAQDGDGAWRRHRSPFTSGGPKSYETHVAWALLEAERAMPGQGYGIAAMKNIDWAVSRQSANGWFKDCGLGGNEDPITHTIGYALRGVIEGWRHSGEDDLLAAAKKTGDAVVRCIGEDGFLPGKLDSEWRPAAKWACVTGSAQLAHCLIMLHEDTGQPGYLEAGRRLNRFVRSTIQVAGTGNTIGGVKGSFPVYGGYGPFRLLNWAAKFTIDSNLAEKYVRVA